MNDRNPIVADCVPSLQWRRGEQDEWGLAHVIEHAHERTIRSCAFSPCGKYIATAGFDAQTVIWEWKGNGEPAHCMCFACACRRSTAMPNDTQMPR